MIAWILASVFSITLATIFKWTVFQMIAVSCLFGIFLNSCRGK